MNKFKLFIATLGIALLGFVGYNMISGDIS